MATGLKKKEQPSRSTISVVSSEDMDLQSLLLRLEGLEQQLADRDQEVETLTQKLQAAQAHIQQEDVLADDLRLRESALTSALTAVVMTDLDTRIIYANPAFVRLWGYRDVETVLGQPFGNFRITPTEAIYAALAKEGFWHGEIEARHADGHTFPVELYLSQVLDEQGNVTALVGSYLDLTERRAIEQELRLMQSAIEAAIHPITILNMEGKLIYANPACVSMWGGESIEKFISLDLMSYWADPEKTAQEFGKFMEIGQQRFILPAKRVDGHIFDAEGFSAFIKDAHGAPIAITSSFMDVSERLQQQRELEASLKEKEILLREIHHRVKNNLQIISSLLYFQSKKFADSQYADAFAEAQSRLQAMALVHEKLYQSPDLSKINMNGYVHTLVNHLVRSFSVGDRIDIEVVAQDIALPISKALPCGMILSEALTNIFKYAYPKDVKGRAIIQLVLEGNGISLSAQDFGVGLPETVQPTMARSFGLQLIHNLVDQIGGHLNIYRESGTRLQVTMPTD